MDYINYGLPLYVFLSHMLMLFYRDQLTIALPLTVNGTTRKNINELFDNYVIKYQEYG